MHWVESLADFEPTFAFRRGKLHLAPDGLFKLHAFNFALINNKLALQEAVHFV